MRSQAFWLVVIGLALAAIVAGYMSGNATAPRVRSVTRSTAPPPVHAVLHDPSDSEVVDAFSDDDVVVERPTRIAARWLAPQLSVVVGLCGNSPAMDAAFMQVRAPVALDIDPNAQQAEAVAQLAHEAGDVVLIHEDRAPSQGELEKLRKRFGQFDGIASRSSARFVQALDGTGLLFFDERGDADGAEFAAVGIPLVQRDATVDDRTASSYIRFMLARVVQRSELEGRLVILMRPRKHSLDALNTLIAARSAQIVALTQR